MELLDYGLQFEADEERPVLMSCERESGLLNSFL
jgi:hypothetical protein